MSSRKAITKLKAILIIDIVIVALVGATYLYLQNQGALAPRPAEFTLSDLTINPSEADLGEPVTIAFNLTNKGEIEGAYVANLTINNIVKENQTIAVEVGETKTVQFTDAETIEGNYRVQIGSLSGSFKIKTPPPESSNITLSNLITDPHEVAIGSNVTIKVDAHNQGSENDSLTVRLLVDDLFLESKKVQLGAGESTNLEFSFNATAEGTHKVKVNNLFASFKAVPPGTHTLTILISPTPDEGFAEFSLNGQKVRTPYTEVLPEGQHTIVFPNTDTTGKHAFLYWENGNENPARTITLTSAIILVAYYEKGTSCPSLYVWNGTQNAYVCEVSNHGWLGYINYMNEDGSIVFYRNNPWDYIPLGNNLLQPKNENYEVTLAQMWDEIFYLDSAYMMVVDHPSNTNVYSTMVEQYLDPNYMGQLYTTSKTPLTPLSAVNEKGQNVLPQISKIDGIFTPGINGLNSPSWNNITWNKLTLNLGDLSKATQTKLVVRAIVDWGSPDDYGTWLNQFYDAAYSSKLANGTQITPPPFLEVKAANGSWIKVPEGRQFPIPPDAVPRTFVVDLTGLFPAGIKDYWIRISNFWNVTFDYIGIDTTTQQNIKVQRINPTANLYQSFSTNSSSSGNFTKYGDVTQLVLNADDMFVVGRQGDAVTLQFPTANLAPPATGMQRDYFFFVSCWFKDENGNWGFGFGFTSDPFPFNGMSGFPYPSTEHYPTDAAHLNYLRDWNTRVVAAR